MNEARAIQFLNAIRKPLLTLHKTILDHERASYEKEFGPITPAAFLQVLINGSGFRWITPLSTIIANIDEVVDDKKATPADKTGAAEAVVALFAPGDPNAIFLPRYLPLLQMNPDMLHAHGQVAQLLREVAEK
ncbi:hypothetical protein [Paraburkholderia sp. GAS334]|jgi:hypothetical protein|uniref:hypothetical protein n=1 Tax=unclassified Paraburkholderia TaxID=2615204 RepID=UPI003D194E67